MFDSEQFLKQLQQKKKQQDKQYKQFKLDIQQLQRRIQSPSIKLQHQRIKITQLEFITLIKVAKTKFFHQPSLLRLQGPIYVSTGTYGSYQELSLIIEKCHNPKFVNYLFLGDYTGKYRRGVQCLVALLVYKVRFPGSFFMLRGCCEAIEYVHGGLLYEEIVEYFGSAKVWSEVCELLCLLPFAATINDQIFCAHGGIGNYLFSLQQINLISRPFNTPKNGLPYDLVYSYPSQQPQYIEQTILRGQFGQYQVESFLKRTNIKLICRGHSISQKGFQFQFDNTLVNLCSISNFCGMYSNSSAVMMIDDQFNVVFRQINTALLIKTQQNYEGLNFQQILDQRKQKQARLQKLEKQENEKTQIEKIKNQQLRIRNLEKQEKRKEKKERKKIKRLKQQILEEKKEKQKLQKQQKAQQNNSQQKKNDFQRQ